MPLLFTLLLLTDAIDTILASDGDIVDYIDDYYCVVMMTMTVIVGIIVLLLTYYCVLLTDYCWLLLMIVLLFNWPLVLVPVVMGIDGDGIVGGIIGRRCCWYVDSVGIDSY